MIASLTDTPEDIGEALGPWQEVFGDRRNFERGLAASPPRLAGQRQSKDVSQHDWFILFVAL